MTMMEVTLVLLLLLVVAISYSSTISSNKYNNNSSGGGVFVVVAEAAEAAASATEPAASSTEQQQQQQQQQQQGQEDEQEQEQVCTTAGDGGDSSCSATTTTTATTTTPSSKKEEKVEASETAAEAADAAAAAAASSASSSSSSSSENDDKDTNDINDNKEVKINKDMRKLAIEFLTPPHIVAATIVARGGNDAVDTNDIDTVDRLRQEHEFYKLLDVELHDTFDVAWDTQNMWGFLEDIGCPSVGENGPLEESTYQHIPNQHNTFNYFYAAYHHVMDGLRIELSSEEKAEEANEAKETENKKDDDDSIDIDIVDIPPKYRRPSIPLSGYTSSLHPFVEPQIVKGKGRGLVATRDIPKGTKLWMAQNAAEFPNSQTYYEFLRILHQMDYTDWYWNRKNRKNHNHNQNNENKDKDSNEKENDTPTTFTPRLVCDAVLWSYTARGGYMSELNKQPWTYNNDSEDKDLDGQFYYLVCIDFDEGSMINGADRDTDDELDVEEAELDVVDGIINVAEKPPDGYKIGTAHYELVSSSASTSSSSSSSSTTTDDAERSRQGGKEDQDQDQEDNNNNNDDDNNNNNKEEKYHFGCQGSAMYATKDIPAGTELRMDYWDSAVPAGWAYLNLGWW